MSENEGFDFGLYEVTTNKLRYLELDESKNPIKSGMLLSIPKQDVRIGTKPIANDPPKEIRVVIYTED